MKLSRRHFINAWLSFIGTSILIDSLWIEKYFIEFKEFYIKSTISKKENIKIIQLSDLHLNYINNQLKKLANKLNTLQPNLIAITGDSIDKADNIPLLEQYLGLIDENIPKVAILGNWEYWSELDLRKLRDVYRKHNCTLLVNESKQYRFGDKTLSIVGIDDFVGGYASYKLATDNFVKSNYNIVLNHCPQYSEQIVQQCQKDGINFILSGHTHGGQIRLLNFIPFLPKGSGKYIKGWYNQLSPPMYVSKGIGTSILPIRFGSRAEVGIFTI